MFVYVLFIRTVLPKLHWFDFNQWASNQNLIKNGMIANEFLSFMCSILRKKFQKKQKIQGFGFSSIFENSSQNLLVQFCLSITETKNNQQ